MPNRRSLFAILLSFFVFIRSTALWVPQHSQQPFALHNALTRVQWPTVAAAVPRTSLQQSTLPSRNETHSTISGEGANVIEEEIGELQPQKDWDLRFGSVGRLYGNSIRSKTSNSKEPEESSLNANSIVKRLRNFTVVIVGLGGVGSWAAEALCRSGVGNLILIDLDDICISNTNRQLHATSSSVGRMKIDQMRQRFEDINPEANVTLIHDFVSTKNVHDVLDQCCSVVAGAHREEETACTQPTTTSFTDDMIILDAIDGGEEKSALIAACTDYEIPIVTCGGAAGKRDPTRIVCEDLVRVQGDKLLASCRYNLRKYYNFPQGLSFSELRKRRRPMRTWRIAAVYSPEEPPKVDTTATKARSSSLRRCDGELGTACFVTGSFGFLAAARCVDMIAGDIPLVAPKRR